MESVVLTGKADGLAGRSEPGCAPDAVHVVGCILWQVEINYMSDIRDMEPTRCHVRCHQNRNFTIMKTPQQGLPLFLGYTP